MPSTTSLLTELLNIESVDVTGYCNDQDSLVFEVTSRCGTSSCPHCGQVSRQIHQHQHHFHLAQDLPMSGKDVFIRYITVANLNARPVRNRLVKP